MEKIFFLISGDNEELGKGEVKACLETYKVEYKVAEDLDQVLIVEIPSLKPLEKISKRLSLSHKIGKVFFICNHEKNEILKKTENSEIKFSGSFAVRIRRIKNCGKNLKILELEREIGRIIKNKTKNIVNLSRPDKIIYGIISNKFILGEILFKINRGDYEKRKPHLRPFFKPGVINPYIARAMVNLSRIKENEKLLDAFCGTGGILIEAGLIGAKVYGIDADKKIIYGCKKNLEFYGIKPNLVLADARVNIFKESNIFDAIVCDPPYGISSRVKAESLIELYKKSLEIFYEILKKGKYLCIVSPENIIYEKFAEDLGFELREVYYERVHKSLTRKIVVFIKK